MNKVYRSLSLLLCMLLTCAFALGDVSMALAEDQSADELVTVLEQAAEEPGAAATQEPEAAPTAEPKATAATEPENTPTQAAAVEATAEPVHELGGDDEPQQTVQTAAPVEPETQNPISYTENAAQSPTFAFGYA